MRSLNRLFASALLGAGLLAASLPALAPARKPTARWC